jgi:hypothetical protein
MKSRQQIQAVYEAIDNNFDAERSEAVSRRDTAATHRIEQKQLLTDQAYFVLCWGQLEAEIDDACRSAIRRRKANANWEMRRGFDFYNPDDKRLSGLIFDRRVALVLDVRGGPGSPYAKVMQYYETRNRIAHGSLAATRIDVVEVIAEFFVIQADLKR